MNRAEHDALHPYGRALDLPIGFDEDSSAPILSRVLTALAASGTLAASRSVNLLPEPDASDDERHSAMDKWYLNFYQQTGDYNLYVALSALAEVASDKAESVARDLMNAYDAGDSYGEWLWQWAEERGVDCDRLIAEAQSCELCRVEPKTYGGAA